MADNKVIVEEKYCHSCNCIEEYQYTWIYKVPSEGRETGASTDSPRFQTGKKSEYEWTIDLYFNGNTDTEDYVDVCIYSYNRDKICNDSNIKAMIKLSIIDKNNKQRMEQSVTLTEQNFNRMQFRKFTKRDDLLSSPDLLPNNELKLMCRISSHFGTNEASHSEMPLSTVKCRNEQMGNFEKMFDNPELSDFQFIVGDTRINVHKCILAAHSDVFAAMFQSDMIEKKKNEVEIEDADADIITQLLRFVYVGEVQDVDDFADKLFIAADKYELNELKYLCEEKIMKKLNIDNLYETLLFVDKYDTSKLKNAAIKFIICNSKKLSAMDEFKKSIENLSSILLAQVICAFMAKSE